MILNMVTFMWLLVPLEFTYKAVAFPGAQETAPTDINNKSEIAGFYVLHTPLPRYHGFVYDGVGFLTVDYPGALDTRVHANNDNGDLCGEFVTAGSQNRAFVRKSGVFSEIVIPEAIQSSCHGINNAGDLSGTYEILVNNTPQQRAFLRKANQQLTLTVPGAAVVEPRDVNNKTHAVGFFRPMQTPNEVVGFVRRGDRVDVIRHPATGNNTSALGISDDGLVVGRFTDNSETHGYLWYRGNVVYDQILVPGSLLGFTEPTAVNIQGEIVGTYFEIGQGGPVTRGFVAIPDGPFSFKPDRFTGLERLTAPFVMVLK